MNDRLVWIDCEMTGLDLAHDALIEIAVLVTDSELTILGDGLDIVMGAPADKLDSMDDVVVAMHASSGLTEAVRASAVTIADAEQQVLDYIRQYVPEPRSAPLAGNSIATDRGFIARDMPALDNHLHYRMVDVSSIKELTRRWYPRVYYAQPEKGMQHRALADIEESIQELRYYRKAVFVPPPGPNTDEARAVAAEVTAAPGATPATTPTEATRTEATPSGTAGSAATSEQSTGVEA
jgi:oligoribonuclease